MPHDSMLVKRRAYLALGGTTITGILAGCSDSQLSGENPEDQQPSQNRTDNEETVSRTPEPTVDLFTQSDKADLLYDEGSDFSDDLIRDDSINENFDRAFTNEKENKIVLMRVTISETIQSAKDEYQEIKEDVINPKSFAHNGFWFDEDGYTRVFFGYRNAFANVSAAVIEGGERFGHHELAHNSAQSLQQSWRF